jgi:Protein of unknown function (DUF3592)
MVSSNFLEVSMSNEDVKFFRMFGSIFAGVGSIIAITGIIMGLVTRSFVTKAIPTQGTVIELVERLSSDSDGDSSVVYYPLVIFTTRSGEATVFEGNAGSNPPAFTKGQQVKVLYSQNKPEEAMIYSWFDLWFFPVFVTSFGSVFLLIGGIVLVKSFPRLRSFTR